MSELSPDYFNRPLVEVDPEIAEALRGEVEREQSTLEMIASENFVPRAVLSARWTRYSPTSTPRATPAAATTGAPSRWTVGELDPAYVEHGRRIAAGVAGATFHCVAGVGHRVALQAPREVARALCDTA